MEKRIGKVGGSVDHFEDLAGGSKYHCRELNHALSLAEQATQAQANQAETHDFLSTTQGRSNDVPGHTQTPQVILWTERNTVNAHIWYGCCDVI